VSRTRHHGRRPRPACPASRAHAAWLTFEPGPATPLTSLPYAGATYYRDAIVQRAGAVIRAAGVGLDTLDDQVIRIYGRPGEAWRRLRVELEALLGPGR
jgi:hypothetical protein